MNTRSLFSAAFAMSALAAFANAPVVSDVKVPDAPWAPTATVNYTLTGCAGIVTFELQTNGVPVDCNYLNVSGDVNRMLQPGDYSFTWRSEVDWPNHKDKNVEAKIVVKAWSTNAPPDYMIVPLVSGSADPVRYYAKAGDIPGGISDIRYKTDYLAMRLIHARGVIWEMGGLSGEPGLNSNEARHQVAFTDDYYIGVYEYTLAQYKLVANMTSYPPYNALGKTEDAATYQNDVSDYGNSRPVVGPCPKYYVCGNGAPYRWPDNAAALDVNANMFFGRLRARTGINRFYLPTSAQWEYACRAGVPTKFNNGSSTDMGSVGWYKGNNSEDEVWSAFQYAPHAVGLKDPNKWGLYDMHGNALEWVCDRSTGSTEKTEDGTPIVDPPGGLSGDSLILRGGCFTDEFQYCGAFDIAAKDYGSQSVLYGFRVTCPATVCK